MRPVSSSLAAPVSLLLLFSADAVRANSFDAMLPLTNSVNPGVQMVAMDMDGDGDLDLLVSEDQESGVVWLENTGGGKLRRAATWRSSSVERCLALADFNGDGVLDILNGMTSSSHADSSFSGLSIRYGVAGGGFAPQDSPLSTAVWKAYRDSGYMVTALDVDGDGKADLITGTGVWLNQGDNAFALTSNWDQSIYVFSAENPEFSWLDGDGDGLEDLYYVASGEVRMLHNEGGGHFAAPVTIVPYEILPSSGVTAISLPELSAQPCLLVSTGSMGNNSALVTLLVPQSGGGYSRIKAPMPATYVIRKVAVLKTPGSGEQRIICDLTTKAQSRTSTYAFQLCELVIKTSNGRVTIKNQALGNRYSGPLPLVTGDLDGDGQTDLIAANGATYDPALAPYNGISIRRGAAGKPFSTKPAPLTTHSTSEVVKYTGDLDGDGDTDFITETGGNSLVLWQNVNPTGTNADLSFTPSTLLKGGGTQRCMLIGVTDANGDGRPDLLVARVTPPRTERASALNEVVLLTRLKNGRTQQKTLARERVLNSAAGDPSWLAVEWVDGDGDGIRDLKVRTYSSTADNHEAYHWIRGLAKLKFQDPAKPQDDFDAESLVDMDWDGDLDQWLGSYWLESPGSVRHELPEYQYHVFPEGTVYYSAIRPAGFDFDGDGHPDYFSYNTVTERLVLAKGDGDPSAFGYPLAMTAAQSYAAPSFPANQAVYDDLDGDGDLDVVWYKSDGKNAYETVWTQENAGGISFSNTAQLGTTAQGSGVTISDLNGDGTKDVIMSSPTLDWAPGLK
jgi:hypothetical protein